VLATVIVDYIYQQSTIAAAKCNFFVPCRSAERASNAWFRPRFFCARAARLRPEFCLAM